MQSQYYKGIIYLKRKLFLNELMIKINVTIRSILQTEPMLSSMNRHSVGTLNNQ